MKKLVLVLIVAVLCTAGLAARGAQEDPISGTWYGGSSFPDHAGFKYIYTFSPIAPNRWLLLCFPVSAPGAYGDYKIMTPFAGEIVKMASGYEARLMCLGASSTALPPAVLPSAGAGRAMLTVSAPDRIELVYDTAGGYAWGKAPFVDDALGWAYRPGNGGPVPETLYRLKTTGDINLK